jgi:hypothetical protein
MVSRISKDHVAYSPGIITPSAHGLIIREEADMIRGLGYNVPNNTVLHHRILEYVKVTSWNY